MPDSRRKLAKFIPVFRPETARKPYLLGRHISYMAYIGEYPRAKNAQLVSLLFLKIRVDISGTFFLSAGQLFNETRSLMKLK